MKELIEYIVKSLVNEPQNITVSKDEDMYMVAVPKAEIGKVIGKQGKVAKAIRAIIKAAAGEGNKVKVEIVEA